MKNKTRRQTIVRLLRQFWCFLFLHNWQYLGRDMAGHDVLECRRCQRKFYRTPWQDDWPIGFQH